MNQKRITKTHARFTHFGLKLLVGWALGIGISSAASPELLNVSYDPTRELYVQVNEAFKKQYAAQHGEAPIIRTSHGGSSKQARTVLDGVPADVVTLGIASDIDQLAKSGLLPENWQSLLPHQSTPYTSTIVFLVRKGNPKNIQDWDDLIQEGINVVTPNPKTSAGARWNYLAAWLHALKKPKATEQDAIDFVSKLYKNVGVLDTGARGSTTTFVERGVGDVLIAWENEALLAVNELGPDKFDVVVPSSSILAEPPVAVVEANAKKHGTEALSKVYLEFLYSPEAQELAARNFYRPRLTEVAERYKDQYPPLTLYTVDEELGGWTVVQDKHFSDNGVFDQLYLK